MNGKKCLDLVLNSPPPLHPVAQVALVVGILVIIGVLAVIAFRQFVK